MTRHRRRGFALLLTVAVVSAALAAAVLGVAVMQREQKNATSALESARAQGVLYAGLSHTASALQRHPTALDILRAATPTKPASVGDLRLVPWSPQPGAGAAVPFGGGHYAAFVMPNAGGAEVTLRVVARVGRSMSAGEFVVHQNPATRLQSAVSRCGAAAGAALPNACALDPAATTADPTAKAAWERVLATAARTSSAEPLRVSLEGPGLGACEAGGVPDSCQPTVTVAPQGLTLQPGARLCGCGLLVVGDPSAPAPLTVLPGAWLHWRGLVVVRGGMTLTAGSAATGPTRVSIQGATLLLDPQGSIQQSRASPKDPLVVDLVFNPAAVSQATAPWPVVERRAFRILY